MPTLPFIAVLLFSLAGCWGTMGMSASITADAPRLVLVTPGVYVVEDQDASIFYSNDYYWRYSDGIWYRSGYYDDGFVRVGINVVPQHIRRIDRPTRYRRYRAGANARVLRRARASRANQRARQRRGRNRHDERNRHIEKRDNRRDGKRKRDR